MIIAANIVSLLASVVQLFAPFAKKKTTMSAIYAASSVIFGISYVMIRSWAALVSILLCLMRNLGLAAGLSKRWFYWVCAALTGIFGLFFNNNGLIGILPVLATIQYTLWGCYCKDAQQLRYGLLINYIPWIFFDFAVRLYTSAVFNIIYLVLVIWNIVIYRRQAVTMEEKCYEKRVKHG